MDSSLRCPNHHCFYATVVHKKARSICLKSRAEIHQALLSQFSLLAELFIGKLAVKVKIVDI
jgi:hypothetical protein